MWAPRNILESCCPSSIRTSRVRILTRRPAILTEASGGFPQSLEGNKRSRLHELEDLTSVKAEIKCSLCLGTTPCSRVGRTEVKVSAFLVLGLDRGEVSFMRLGVPRRREKPKPQRLAGLFTDKGIFRITVPALQKHPINPKI